MRVVQFTVPIANDYSIVVQEDILPQFYNYFHRHKEIQITLIIKGEGTLIAGNYTQPFNTGDIYIIGSNQPHIFHSPITEGKNNIHAIHIFFDPKNGLSGLLNMMELAPVRNFIDNTVSGLQVPSSRINRTSHIIKKIRDSESLDRLMLLVKLLKTFALNSHDLKPLSTGYSNHTFKDAEGIRLNGVYQYTIDHYAENISINKIASIACITPHAFCKYFKRHTRRTYLSFLNEIRINEACKRIISGEFNSISSIAYLTGFNSITTFNRVFKSTYAMSPKDYIHNYKIKAKALPFKLMTAHILQILLLQFSL